MARKKRNRKGSGESNAAKVRMADVAERAGVSKAVVSAVLNPHGKSKIRYSDDTRREVLEAVDELGYRLNTTASNFLSGRHGSIGLLVPTLGHVPGDILSGMLRQSQDSGYMLTIEEVKKGGDEPPRMFLEDCVDGIVLYGFLDQKHKEKARELEIPVVDVNSNDRTGPGSITYAEEEGAALAARFFAEQGRKRPAIVLPEDESHFSVQARATGFCEEAVARGLPEPVVVRKDTGRYWYDEARAFLKNYPDVDCVFLYNSPLAMVLYDELRVAERSVPDDVAVIGAGSHTVAYAVRPSLTHLYLDHGAVGRGVVRALLEVVDGKPVPDELRCFSYGLAERYST